MTVQPVPRWRGLDALRGLAVIGMLLVNNPGDHDAVYAPLRHSAWNGCTVADLVFPIFLFVVGITTTISLESLSRRGDERGATLRIWRRAGTIFAIGVLLNWFPFYQSGDLGWTSHAGMLDRIVARLLLLRIPGVMQRIAVAFLAAALIARRASSRAIAVIVVLLLAGYWALLALAPVPGEAAMGAQVLDQPSRTIAAHVDRALFDWSRWGLGNHLWDSALTWDPEGAVSTLSAVGTVLIGVLTGRWMLDTERRHRTEGLVAASTLMIVVGWVWALTFPFNKSLWTSSYVLFTAGIAGLLLAAVSVPLARWPDAPGAFVLLVFGENPLIAYAGSELSRRILHSSVKIPSGGSRLGVDEWVVRQLEAIHFSPEAASLAWSVIFIAGWWIALARLSRRRLFVRV